jgi:hypothetical protein
MPPAHTSRIAASRLTAHRHIGHASSLRASLGLLRKPFTAARRFLCASRSPAAPSSHASSLRA